MCEKASKFGQKEMETRKIRRLDDSKKQMGGDQSWEKSVHTIFLQDERHPRQASDTG